MSQQNLPPTIICPHCGNQIQIFLDNKGLAKTEDIFTMRIMTPIYVKAGLIKETSTRVVVCSKCHKIISTGSKM